MCHYLVVFTVCFIFIVPYNVLQILVPRTGFCVYRHQLPVVFSNRVSICINHYVEAAQLVGAGACLHDEHIVFNSRLIGSGV